MTTRVDSTVLSRARRVGASVIAVALASFFALPACKEEPKRGACEVTYDMIGTKGKACTVVPEPECKDDVNPPVMQLASSKKDAFTADKTCKDVGYETTGCADVPIAWAFKGPCPK